MKGPKIGRHRRNNTHQAPSFGVVGTDATVAALGSQMQKDKDGLDDYDRKIFQHFREELTLKDLENSSEEIEMSLRELTRANVMELRAISKPSPMVEKTLQIVCALRGFKNLNWSTARDFLGKTSLKIELKQTSSRTVKSVDVFRSQQILVQKTNTMLTPEVSKTLSILLFINLFICIFRMFKYTPKELLSSSSGPPTSSKTTLLRNGSTMSSKARPKNFPTCPVATERRICNKSPSNPKSKFDNRSEKIRRLLTSKRMRRGRRRRAVMTRTMMMTVTTRKAKKERTMKWRRGRKKRSFEQRESSGLSEQNKK